MTEAVSKAKVKGVYCDLLGYGKLGVDFSAPYCFENPVLGPLARLQLV